MSAADGRWHVQLGCGHHFMEHRPTGIAQPVEGELRVCADMNHYPSQYPASYTDPDLMESAHRTGLELIDEVNQWATIPAEQQAEAFAWLVGQQTQTLLDILKLIPDDRQVALVADLVANMRKKVGH